MKTIRGRNNNKIKLDIFRQKSTISFFNQFFHRLGVYAYKGKKRRIDEQTKVLS